MRTVNARSLTLRYCLALGLVGLCTLTSHLILTRVLYEHRGSAFLINLSGRQRMLSQRIASLAAQKALGDAGAQSDLVGAIDLFDASFRTLLAGSDRWRPLEEIYEGQGLSAEVRDYVARARHLAAMGLHDPGLPDQARRLFALSRESLIRKLDAVVGVYQRDSEQNLARMGQLQSSSLIVVIITLLAEALGIFRPMVSLVERHVAELLHLSRTDELTQVSNRRAFFESAEIQLGRARRSGGRISIIMIDVDHFKRVNDTHGHAGGDAVLRCVSAHLRQSLRPYDTVGRLGGEEFAVLVPDADHEIALNLAGRIRQSIASLAVVLGNREIRVTVSIGVATSHEDLVDAGALVALADAALYVAKSEGRNRVISAESRPEVMSGEILTKIQRPPHAAASSPPATLGEGAFAGR